MQDNVNNYFGTAPDHGSLTGPVLGQTNVTRHGTLRLTEATADDYWLSSLGSAGQVSLSGSPRLHPFPRPQTDQVTHPDALCRLGIPILPQC